jgi:thiosulfate/3-mercaptopyruvate sulfurtransferase
MRLEIPTTPLVSTSWLAAHLDNPQLRIIDIRGQLRPLSSSSPQCRAERAAYEAGHIPGALFIDWMRDILDQDEPIPARIGSVEQLTALFGNLGIRRSTLVVAYDHTGGAFAGLLRWVLYSLGHDAIRLLDGGFSRWCAEGRPLSTEQPFVLPAAFAPVPRATLRHAPYRAAESAEIGRGHFTQN